MTAKTLKSASLEAFGGVLRDPEEIIKAKDRYIRLLEKEIDSLRSQA